jgi:RNA polymerase sigma-70 factor (ECF subfamily)
MNDGEAIQRLKRGDISGLEHLVSRYQVKAMRAAFLITRDELQAEDVVQDTFLAIYQHIHSFDERRPFEPWFMRSVCRNAIKATQRQARFVPIEADDAAALIDRLAELESSPEAQAETMELQRRLWSAMQRLSLRQRAVIVQRYYLGMNEREMSDELTISRGTVKWLLNAARQRLRNLLAPERSLP